MLQFPHSIDEVSPTAEIFLFTDPAFSRMHQSGHILYEQNIIMPSDSDEDQWMTYVFLAFTLTVVIAFVLFSFYCARHLIKQTFLEKSTKRATELLLMEATTAPLTSGERDSFIVDQLDKPETFQQLYQMRQQVLDQQMTLLASVKELNESLLTPLTPHHEQHQNDGTSCSTPSCILSDAACSPQRVEILRNEAAAAVQVSTSTPESEQLTNDVIAYV